MAPSKQERSRSKGECARFDNGIATESPGSRGDGVAMRKLARSRRKLAFFGALFPYLGGKRRLCPVIFREIDRLLPRREWPGRTFLDGFLGGGSVSLYAKAMGFKVAATDIAERSIVVGRALIENSRTKLTREDVVRILTPNPEPALRVEREMVPQVFTRNVARFIDRALARASVTTDPAKAGLLKMLAIRVALLEHPMSQVRKGTIHRMASGEYEAITESCVHHYVDGLRLTRLERVWSLAQQINRGVFAGEGRVLQRSIFDVLPEVQADVAYFDPPYPGVMSYEKEYRVIDQILEGASKPTSPFTAKDGAALIDGLFERAGHIPIWLLSLGNEVVTLGELEEKMKRLGRETRAIEIRHQHLPAVATEDKKQRNREFLVVGWDPAASLLQGRSVTRDLRHVSEIEVGDVVPDLHVDPDGGRALGPAAGTLAENRLERGEPTVPEQLVPGLRIEAVADLDPNVDAPHTIRDEVAAAAHDEVVHTPEAGSRRRGTVKEHHDE